MEKKGIRIKKKKLGLFVNMFVIISFPFIPVYGITEWEIPPLVLSENY